MVKMLLRLHGLSARKRDMELHIIILNFRPSAANISSPFSSHYQICLFLNTQKFCKMNGVNFRQNARSFVLFSKLMISNHFPKLLI